MKFSVFATVAALTAIVPFSAHAEVREGFYAGIVAGYSHTDFDLEAGPVGSGPNQYGQSNLHSGDSGIMGGYRHHLPCNFFVAAEADIVASTGSESGLFGANVEVEKDSAFGVYVKSGYQINEKWDGFLTLGAQWIEYTVSNSSAGFQESDSSGGFLYGLGATYRLDEEVSLTAEYNRVQPLDGNMNSCPA